jgi:hypothetical protein
MPAFDARLQPQARIGAMADGKWEIIDQTVQCYEISQYSWHRFHVPLGLRIEQSSTGFRIAIEDDHRAERAQGFYAFWSGSCIFYCQVH